MRHVGVITLGRYAAVHESLTFGCRRCWRSGRYRMTTLLARYGPDCGIPHIIADISADCPRHLRKPNEDVFGQCGAFVVEEVEG